MEKTDASPVSVCAAHFVVFDEQIILVSFFFPLGHRTPIPNLLFIFIISSFSLALAFYYKWHQILLSLKIAIQYPQNTRLALSLLFTIRFLLLS